MSTRIRTHRRSLVLAALALVAAACSDSSSNDTTSAPATTVAPSTTAVATTAPGTTVAPATTAPAPDQPAVWPAAGVVFTTPEVAAEDFLANVFPTPGPVIGEFRAGDSRSGEIDVFAAGENGEPIGNARSVLFLRQLGPVDGWFVIGAGSDLATIERPESLDVVQAGPLTVSGRAQGFEANIGIMAFVAGAATPLLDSTTTMAGNMGEVLPYSVTLDLSAAQPGDVVVVLVHGGAGLETDPGDFSAIPVVISSK
jgi:hypothetical protein